MTMLAPMLSVRAGKQALAFYAEAFGAVANVHAEDDDGRIIAEVTIGDAFWVSDESPPHANYAPDTLGGSTTRMVLIVEDPDASVSQAIKAGARMVSPVAENYGWRTGRVRDPFGHHWEICRKLD